MSPSFQSLRKRILLLLTVSNAFLNFLILSSCFLVTMTPFFAKAMTGLKISFTDNRPNFSCALKTPATVPGTPTAVAPTVLFPLIIFPSLSRYISLVAAKGAFSL